jgi:hypothetical protein
MKYSAMGKTRVPSRNHNKNKDVIKELEKNVSPILIVNNSSLKPYVELFEYAPENVYQQPLGLLVGFFEIKEYSEDSAYIVNFLTSVLKKEYYINPKRSVSESLDSALHKVNMALSELAKHGNIEWLGKLNAAICVFEKNNAHFSIAGGAKIFLYRGGTLSDVSDGIASDSAEPHPLKTFVNVSSGRLEKDDRMLITSEDIFHILSPAQLRKNFERFENKKFVQFLKTALSNQLEMIASLVVETKEKEVVEVKIPEDKKNVIRTENFFSRKTYEKAVSAAAPEHLEKEPKKPERETEYTDKKTGHIYVQGEPGEVAGGGKAYIYWNIAKEKLAQNWYSFKIYLGGRASLLKRNVSKKIELAKIERNKRKQAAIEEELKKKEQKTLAEAEEKKKLEQQEKEREQLLIRQKKEEEERDKILKEHEEKTRLEKEREAQLLEKQREKEHSEEKRNNAISVRPQTLEKIRDIQQAKTEEEPRLSFREKLNLAIIEHQKNLANNKTAGSEKEKTTTKDSNFVSIFKDRDNAMRNEKKQIVAKNENKFFSRYLEKQKTFLREAKNKTENLPKIFERENRCTFDGKNADEITEENNVSIKPDFSKIKKLFESFSLKQKISASVAIAAIVIIPFFIASWLNKQPEETQTAEEPVQSAPIFGETPLASEKNMNLTPDERTIISRSGIVSALATGDSVVAVTKENVIVINGQEQKEHPLPEEAKNPVKATYMEDLALVFIITDKNNVVSFSPVSSRFAANTINIEGNPSSLFIGTYMTYLYVLDPANSEIYRYPRATGGFGEKTAWLKDKIMLSPVNDMIIDENIYCAIDEEVVKLFKGSRQDFQLEQSNTPIKFNRIYTSLNSQFFYALDFENSRLVKYDKASGSIIKQYFSEKIKNAISFSVNNQDTTAYVATSDSLISIAL